MITAEYVNERDAEMARKKDEIIKAFETDQRAAMIQDIGLGKPTITKIFKRTIKARIIPEKMFADIRSSLTELSRYLRAHRSNSYARGYYDALKLVMDMTEEYKAQRVDVKEWTR